MKAFLRALALFLALFSLSGCISWSAYSPSSTGEVTYPGYTEPMPDSLVGDSRADYVYNATLFYVSLDYKRLVPIMRDMRVLNDDLLPAKVIERLLMPAGTSDVRSVAPEGTTLLSYEQSQGIATVNLSIDARALTEQEILWMCIAITNTLTEFPEVSGVNVLIGGQAESVLGLPMGTLTRTWENLSTIYTQYMIEETQFIDAKPAESPLSRRVTLYFASADGKHIVPELRSVEFESANLVDELLRELLKGPGEASYKRRVLPAKEMSGALLTRASDIITTEEGLRIVHLYFNPGILDAMNREGLSVWQLYGALTLTLCRAVPEVDGIMINIGDGLVVQADNGVEEVSFKDGYMMPAVFSSLLGSAIELYFTGEDGYLTAVNRVVDLKYAFSPRAWLKELIAGPMIPDGEVQPVIPDGILESDVLAIRIEAETMMINLSSNFYRCCQNLSQQAERNLIYAIVNTMTGFHDVKRVRFFVEGEAVDSLAGPIALSGPLLKNPGIVH